MPFDGWVSRPSLPALAELLRDRERWPKDFVWDYRHFRGCALGLTDRVWGLRGWRLTDEMDDEVRSRIFFCASDELGVPMSLVLPEDIADLIDAHLAGAGAGSVPRAAWWRRVVGWVWA